MTLQGKMPDPTGTNNCLWTSPERDIAHTYPLFVRRALELTENEINKVPHNDEMIKQLGTLASLLAAFVNCCAGMPEANLAEAGEAIADFENSDCGQLPASIFNKWLARVFAGAYFKGIREALHCGQKAVGASDLDTFVKQLGSAGERPR